MGRVDNLLVLLLVAGVPLAFLYFSIGGGLILLVYAIERRDPVFTLGQSMGIFIYARNLWLIRAERRGN